MFESLKKMFKGESKTMSIKSPAEGRTIPMSEVDDQTFAQELLGPGIAICPSKGRIVSPVDGTVTMVFDTNHAVCVQSDDGVEIIVHAGLDTVQLKGKHYTAKKKAGDQVKAGDVLLELDLEAITKAGYDVTTPIVITNLRNYKISECFVNKEVREGEEVMKLEEK